MGVGHRWGRNPAVRDNRYVVPEIRDGGAKVRSDVELIEASIADPEAFAEIFERHFSAIHRYLARRVGRGLADELSGQVFTIAFERRRTFRPGTTDARPWLYGIGTNLIRNQRRTEQRLLGVVARLGRERLVVPGPEEGPLGDLEDPRIARALAQLDADQRDVLLLHVWGELSHAEIATSLDVPMGTVASRLSRARGHLRRALADAPVATSSSHATRRSPMEEEHRW